jgi:D-glycero-alpha-D-manno-heptose-7-phosphate kinase
MRAKHALAEDAIYVEQQLLQEAVGAQDQVSAAYGGLNRINFETDGSIQVQRLLTTPARVAELERHLALYFTGFSRIASEVAKEQIRMTPHRQRELETMYEMVNEAEDLVVNSNRPIAEFGKLLNESWKLKRSLTGNISNSNIDEIYEAGLRSGALGGKLLGAGGGGFMLFFVPPENREALRERLRHLLCIPFSFSDRGSHVVLYEPEAVYDQALAQERVVVYNHSRTKAASVAFSS